MQVTFKTLKQTSFKLECSEDETVASVKAKIETEKGDEFPATSQKLIHSGKIMEDGKQLKDYKVSEKGFIVVMVTTKGKVATEPASKPATSEEESKPEAKPAEPATPAEAESSKPQEKPAEPTKESTTPKEASETPAASTPAVPAASQQSETTAVSQEAETDDFGNALLTGSDFEACVERIMAMGFPREEVHQAMRLSYNNPDRAVEYLISGNMPQERDPPSEQGIGGDSQQAQPEAPVQQAPQQAVPQQASQAPASGGADPFRELITQPQFQQMRQVLQSNPQLLAQLMEQLYRTNPELFQVIRNNQERFLAYLNEGSMEGGGGPELGGGGQPPVAMPEAQDPFSGAGGPGNTIRMTPQEREAIERLKALGFPEMMVIQAYFACDKNEDAAANFLLSEAFGDDD